MKNLKIKQSYDDECLTDYPNHKTRKSAKKRLNKAKRKTIKRLTEEELSK